ncbi:hypothetical protein EV702DRAFT_511182 [Suillus placidus]|uniref:Uncharacterized protein n=1 Tax=Suillus placidus TaxID=48579 RepID=A0A9P7D7R5_9AGAM|nr:hypothetical protein EV702DRAFT_511182 [Suillus placidus]
MCSVSSKSPWRIMQLTLLASLAVLCSAAFAAPSERRDSNSLAEIIAYVDNDLNDVTVDVLKRDDALVKVIADVQDDLDNLTVKVLTARDDALVKVIADVQDDLDNLTVKVLTPSKRDNVDLVDVEACKYYSHNFWMSLTQPHRC